MADVKWIKLAINIFDNRKIRMIESLPDGNAVIVVWLKLLCLAGNINDTGMIYFTKEIPYTEQMLATQFNMPLTTIQLAFKTFQQFEMIEIVDNMLRIANWEKYQNVDGMERIRENNRNRKRIQREREKQALLESESRDSHVTVTQCHAIEEERREEIGEKEEDIIISPTTSPKARHKYGAYNNVLLSDEDMDKLKDEFPTDWEARIERLSEYIASKGAKYKNHLATIRSWARKEQPQQKKESEYDKFMGKLQQIYDECED